jgi:hypothetical protein
MVHCSLLIFLMLIVIAHHVLRACGDANGKVLECMTTPSYSCLHLQFLVDQQRPPFDWFNVCFCYFWVLVTILKSRTLHTLDILVRKFYEMVGVNVCTCLHNTIEANVVKRIFSLVCSSWVADH